MKKFYQLFALLLSMVLLLTFAGCSGCGSTTVVQKPSDIKPSTWVTGETAPTAEQGSDGDLYLDYSTWNVYKKVNDTWVPLGKIAPDAPAAPNTWMTGETAPTPEQGDDGDLYLDSSTWNIYKKVNDTWVPFGNIAPDAPAAPNTWMTGETAPTAEQGDDGDLYLDSSTWNIYKKLNDTWVPLGNIAPDAPAAPNTWMTGETAPTPGQGNDGDLYLDSSTWIVYKKVNETWVPLGKIASEETAEPEHPHRFTAEATGFPCDPEGYVTYSCECGYSFVVENYLGHVLVDNTCVYCGYRVTYTFSGYTSAAGLAGEDGNPIPDVEIVLQDEEGTEYTARSNGEGYYEIPNLPEGHYHAAFHSTDESFADVEFEFDLGSNLTRDIVFDYQQDSVLTGKITVADSDLNYANNVPMPDATVTLTKSDIFRRSTTTKTDGTYRFDGLPSGSYRMTIEKEGYIPLVQNIEIARGITNVQNSTLELVEKKSEVTTGSAAGMVYDALKPGEVGIEGLTLSVRGGINNLTGDVLTTLQTGANGAYLLENFPAGNYTIEIHDGRELNDETLRYNNDHFNVKIIAGEVIRNQNGSTVNAEKVGQLRIKLTWGSEPADLDSHLTGPEADGNGRFHIDYSSKSYSYNSTVYADLDRDDTDCFGPETTTIYVESEGVYRFSVHDYSNKNNYSSRGIATSGATVEVYFGDRLYYTFHAPDEAGTVWTVFEYDSRTKQLTQINTMGNSIT